MTLLARPAHADTLPIGGTHHLTVRLVAESDHPAAGSTVTVALATTPEPGWHGYWQNPGDAGYPATLKWTLPRGVGAGDPAYPVPTTLLIAGLMNYVYEAPYAPLVTLRVPAGLAAGSALPVRLDVNYLVCSATLCVPESASLALDLTVGDGRPDPARAAQFDRWRRALPRPLGGTATWQVAGGRARIAVPLPAGAAVTQAYFFPVTGSAIDYAAPQQVARDGDRLVIDTAARDGAPAALDGVLRIAPDTGLLVHAVRGSVPAAAAGGEGDAGAGQGTLLVAALSAFGLALVGGLLLNVMPCVFPILSLKALALVREHADEAAARREALAYTAGVVLVCVGLGAAILGLRAGGATIGWAFQLQDPRAIVVLLLLSAGIAFNLAGLFELPVPRFVNAAGVAGGGAGGAFATGALAAFIATPCTGPFMGAALGAALVLPWPAALAVFAGLGLGLALPFLLIGFVPRLRRLLPRPGGWMELFRRVLAVPMFLTAIALGWVLGKQAGVDALGLALVAVLALGLVLWSAGNRQRRGLPAGWLLAIGLLVVAVAAVALLPRSAPAVRTAAAGGAEQPFSEARLAALRAAKRPVFAYFTADWCLTCKVNERTSIDNEATRAAFSRAHVAVLVGDWTSGDPVLGRFIEAHNRAGVPLYLYYPPGGAAPRLLPQVLTPALLQGLAR